MKLGNETDRYPSRITAKPQLLPRIDPVVYSEDRATDGVLTRQQLDAYERDGFIFLPGMFNPDEVAVLSRELHRLAESDEMRGRDEAIYEPESDALRSMFDPHILDEFFWYVSCDRRLVRVAQQIVGSDVYMHQSRINLKPGFVGKEFDWHSDFETWHVEDGMPRMRCVSCSVLLTENTAWNGSLMLLPGSHRHFVACVGETPEENYRQSLRKQTTGVPDRGSLEVLYRQGGLKCPSGPAGSVLFFDCNTMHGSNSNISPLPRSNLFFVFNSVHNRLVSPFGGLSPRPEFVAHRERVPAIDEQLISYD